VIALLVVALGALLLGIVLRARGLPAWTKGSAPPRP
jgi:hypothetical protein